jgi:uncharacterized membrane protein YgaE (UPF0421/DUF939 family)
VSSQGAFARLRDGLWPIAQTALAAALAWLIATKALNHHVPFFAPVAAIVSLGATRGQRAQRAIELMVGVALGIAAGDLLTRVIGVGVVQLGVIVALAMAAAISLGAGLLMLSEAGVSATLVATVSPTTRGLPPARLLDALVGGAVALLFSQLLFPIHPVKLVRQSAEEVLRELSATLASVAQALERRDRTEADSALLRARRTSAVWSRFEHALDVGREAAHYAPVRRRQRGPFRVYRDIGLPLGLIVADVNVLARAAVRALQLADDVPDDLPAALRDLSRAADLLADRVGKSDEDPEVSSIALRATYAATALTPSGHNMSLSVLVAYTQATAADLLRALGMDREPAHTKVGEAAQAALR